MYFFLISALLSEIMSAYIVHSHGLAGWQGFEAQGTQNATVVDVPGLNMIDKGVFDIGHETAVRAAEVETDFLDFAHNDPVNFSKI